MWWVGGIFFVAIFALAIPFGIYTGDCVCSTCGTYVDRTEFHIPYTPVIFFKTSRESATPVSTVLTSNGIVGPHKHHWAGIHGGGNGIFCAIGSGQYYERSVQSPNVARLILETDRLGEFKIRDRLIKAIFDERVSDLVYVSVPSNDLPDASALHAWLADSRFFEQIDGIIRMKEQTGRDVEIWRARQKR